jgi:hypothetical protein
MQKQHMSLSKKIFTVLFLSLSITCVFSQEIREWKVDSLSTRQTSSAHWKIDSVEYIPQPVLPNRLSDNMSVSVSGMGIFTDGDFAPFWLTNNQYGIGSSERGKGYLRVDYSAYKNIDHNFNISGSIDFLGGNNLSSDFYFQQYYVDLGYRNDIKLSIGAKEKQSLLKNNELSSGGLTLSSNARPIPQVEISLPRFLTIPSTRDQLHVMGGVSYGWFIDNKFKKENAADGYYADKVLYHRKYGFLKYTPTSAWDFIFGLEMDTQWGGHFYQKGNLKYKGSAKLKDFFKVLVPMSGGSESNITDKANIVGNVYGSVHLAAAYKREDFAIKAYHEHFFEDQSGLFFKNMPDGLYGIEIKLNKNSWLSDILFEYLHSKDQSGPFLWDKNEEIPTQVSGGDNYYNHVDYISLSNYGYTVGNPLFTSPIYNKGQSLTIYNTRLSSFHGGISGNIHPNLRYRALVTYSRSWGTPLIPSVKIRDQFSTMLEATYTNRKLNGWLFSGAFAYDKSQMIGDNTGMQVKVSKTFDIPMK